MKTNIIKIAILSILLFPGMVFAVILDPYSIYEIQQYNNSAECMDVSGASTSSGATVDIWAYGGGANQQWLFKYTTNGYYKIVNYNSGLLLSPYVSGGLTNLGDGLTQYAAGASGNAELWQLTDMGGGYYTISNMLSGFVVNPVGNGTNNGTTLCQWDINGNTAELWKLVKVGVVPPSGSWITVYPTNSAALNNIISTAASGSTILLKAGTYSITNKLSPASKTSIVGEMNTILKLNYTPTDYQGAIINLWSGRTNILIRNLNFVPGSANGSGTASAVIFGADDNNIQVTGCSFTNFVMDDVDFYTSDNITNDANFHYNPSGDGVSLISNYSGETYTNNVVWHNYFWHQNRIGIETQGQSGGTYNTLLLDYNEFDNTGLSWGIGISAVGESASGNVTSIRHNSFKNFYWAVEVDNQLSRVEYNYFTNVTYGIEIADTPNSIYQTNTFVNVTQPFGQDNGYSGYLWVGNNVYNGSTVFDASTTVGCQSGMTPNNPVSEPNIWQPTD